MCNQQYDQILDFEDACRFLKLSKRKVRYLLKEGKIPHRRVAAENGGQGKMLFDRDQLYEAFNSWK